MKMLIALLHKLKTMTYYFSSDVKKVVAGSRIS